MLIIGCDYHPGFQQIALVDRETGECGERRLAHREEAEQFYREKQRGLSVRMGMESSGHARWFERLLHELGLELWIGDAERVVDPKYLDQILTQAKQFSNKLLSRQSGVARCAIINFKQGKNTIKARTLRKLTKPSIICKTKDQKNYDYSSMSTELLAKSTSKVKRQGATPVID
jgi:hypothetical protein